MHVETYDSMESMQAAMAAAEQAANERLLPAQIALRDAADHDVYWVRPAPEFGCLIFGRAFGYAGICEASAKYVPDLAVAQDPRDEGATMEDYDEAVTEAVDEIRGVLARRSRGYMYGEAWSTLEPRGELGDTHVANAYPISEAAFLEAKQCGWQAVEADPLVALMIPPEELAKRTTPTLIAELRAMGEDARQHQ